MIISGNIESLLLFLLLTPLIYNKYHYNGVVIIYLHLSIYKITQLVLQM